MAIMESHYEEIYSPLLAGEMAECLRAKTSIRAAVKEHISRFPDFSPAALAERIAITCGIFKKYSEEEIAKSHADASLSAKQELRKRANNVINDVSRICRELLGYSIVNYKRTKGEYAYKAVISPIKVRSEHDLSLSLRKETQKPLGVTDLWIGSAVPNIEILQAIHANRDLKDFSRSLLEFIRGLPS